MVELNVKMVQRSFARTSSSRKDLEKVIKMYEDARATAEKESTRESIVYLEKCYEDVGSAIKDVSTRYKKKYSGKDKSDKQHQAAIKDLEQAWSHDRGTLRTLKETREKSVEGKPKNFEWHKKLEYKSKDFELFDGCKYGGEFRVELMLPPDSPPAMIDRLYHHLFGEFTREEKKFLAWIKKNETELNRKCDKLKKTGKADPQVLAKSIRKELATSTAARIDEIERSLAHAADDFFVKNAEAKQLAKKFKVKVKTRLARDLILGNLSYMVSAITGSVTGGIKGAVGGASAGAATGPAAPIAAPLLGTLGGIAGALVGPAKALINGVTESFKAIKKSRRDEQAYRKKVETLLLEARSDLQTYQDISDQGGAGKNVGRNISKWGVAFRSTTQKLSKAVEQHGGSFAVMLQLSDKLSQDLQKKLDELTPHEKEFSKLTKQLATVEKKAADQARRAKTSREKKAAGKEIKDVKKLAKDLRWWNGKLDTLRKPFEQLFNQISRMNERAETSKSLQERHRGLLTEVNTLLADLENERAAVLGKNLAKRIDETIDFLHTIAPYSDAFFKSGKQAVAGAVDIVTTAKSLK